MYSLYFGVSIILAALKKGVSRRVIAPWLLFLGINMKLSVYKGINIYKTSTSEFLFGVQRSGHFLRSNHDKAVERCSKVIYSESTNLGSC